MPLCQEKKIQRTAMSQTQTHSSMAMRRTQWMKMRSLRMMRICRQNRSAREQAVCQGVQQTTGGFQRRLVLQVRTGMRSEVIVCTR